ncbi:MAG: Asp-tRNA(Asn)/Glu-tRNA(Gln) amidotransferase subunit GatB [Candidatus Saccharimonadia bacterium]
MTISQTEFETVIGIETHVQLKTKTKLFCSCDNDAKEALPNTKICPVCLGLPGTLPVLNEQAVILAIKANVALNGKLAARTKFDRKNYFYPDLPKGYQITQFDQPIIGRGYIEIYDGEQLKKIGITRAHMEEDAGKLTHPEGANYSLVDLNRAGTPLLEIVSEPDLRSPAQAKAYAQEIYTLMRYAEVSEANLYYGNMRFDVNVSVRPKGSVEFGTRAEVKNLNSFRAVERASEYEQKRQIDLISKGHKIVQETRGWNEAKQQTYSQRSKEEAHDYRYFPEPDIPPIVITKTMVDQALNKMPKLPNVIREEMLAQGLTKSAINTLLIRIGLTKLYFAAQAIDPHYSKLIGNWLVGLPEEIATELEDQITTENLIQGKIAQNLNELAAMQISGRLSTSAAKQILEVMLKNKKAPEGIAAELKLFQNSDNSQIETLIDEVIAENPIPVDQFKSGETKVAGFLVGQVMKKSHGQANPQVVGEILASKLAQ